MQLDEDRCGQFVESAKLEQAIQANLGAVLWRVNGRKSDLGNS